MEDEKTVLVLVTGRSGSGIGTSIKILEDLGYYSIDNLPFELIVPTLDLLEEKAIQKKSGIAIGVHIHSSAQAEAFTLLQKNLKIRAQIDILFLTAQDDVLLTRYNATRRKHPFDDAAIGLIEAIEKEKLVLKPLEACANLILDTTYFSPQDLAWQIEKRLSPDRIPRKLHITLTSFGFKHGVCHPIDMLFDVRFLKNPFFVLELKEKSGLDKDVSDYILSDPESQEFLEKLIDLHEWLIPRFHREGKHYFRVGIGCTGGKHRSVCVVESLSREIQKYYPGMIEVSTYHRDINH